MASSSSFVLERAPLSRHRLLVVAVAAQPTLGSLDEETAQLLHARLARARGRAVGPLPHSALRGLHRAAEPILLRQQGTDAAADHLIADNGKVSFFADRLEPCGKSPARQSRASVVRQSGEFF